jgi:hypothetical protein
MKRFILSLSVAAALAAGCAAEKSNQEKVDLADEYLSEHGGEPGYRAAAYDMYQEVLDDGPDDKAQAVRAHFGVGMIGFLDLVQGVPKLLEKPAGGEESSSEMPPAAALAKTIDALVHEVIDRGIVQHFDVVRREKDFHFTFKALVFPVTDAATTPIDLSGEWDQGEIGAIYGLLNVVVGAEELAWSYNQVPETVLKVALTDAEIPAMPSNPGELPKWVSDAAKAVGFAKLPWLEKDFGTLTADKAKLAAIRTRFDGGTQALADAFTYTADESDPQDDDVFPKNKYINTLVKKLLNSDDQDLNTTLDLAAGILPPQELANLVQLVNDSIHNDDKPLVLPKLITDIIDLVDSNDPKILEPVTMRLPAFNLSSLFTHPITDLKDTAAGLFPYFDPKTGEFVLETEQEPYDDANGDDLIAAGEYKDIGVDGFWDRNYDGIPDTGSPTHPGAGNSQWNDPLGLNDETKAKPTNPPLGHKSPTGRMEPANDVVDQVYLFFGDASFGGFLVPTTTATDPGVEAYSVDTSGKKYENQDLMRLSSTIFWFAATQDISL